MYEHFNIQASKIYLGIQWACKNISSWGLIWKVLTNGQLQNLIENIYSLLSYRATRHFLSMFTQTRNSKTLQSTFIALKLQGGPSSARGP